MINTKEILNNAQIAAKKNNTLEMQKLAFSCIDLTTLSHTDTATSVAKFTNNVNTFSNYYPDMPHVAAICVHPNMASVVRKKLSVNKVNIATVAAGFPASQTFLKIKIMESELAVENGANEVDVVISLSTFLDNNNEATAEEISLIKKAIGNAHLKVIIESGTLHTDSLIYNASMLAMKAGADFIKTSTGKTDPAATPEAAIVMCSAIKEFYHQTGKKIGFKPAGGIVTTQDAILYITIVESILGKDWLTPELFRIGASRLANNLLSDIMGKVVNHF